MIADPFYAYFSYIEKINPGAELVPFLLTSFLFTIAEFSGVIFLARIYHKTVSFLPLILPTILIAIPTLKNILIPLTTQMSAAGFSLSAFSGFMGLSASLFIFHFALRVLVCSRDSRLTWIAMGYLLVGVTEWGIQFETVTYHELKFSFYDVVWFLGVCLIGSHLILPTGEPIRKVTFEGKHSLIQSYRLYAIIIVLLPISVLSLIFKEDHLERVIFFANACMLGLVAATWSSNLLESSIKKFSELMALALSDPTKDLRVNRHYQAIPQELRESFISVTTNLLERERSRRELELRAAQDLASLAAQVAHDIRSPVGALEMTTKALRDIPPESRDLLQQITARIRRIADSLVQTYRVQALMTNTNISEIKKRLESLVSEKTFSHPQISLETNFTKLDNHLELFLAGRMVDFERMMSNLLDNAIESKREDCRLQIELSAEAVANSLIIEISDNGRGIPEEHLTKLGDQGFTFGKPKGTGLGLNFVKTVVQELNGKIEFSSKPGMGTRVKIELPLSKA